MVLDNRIWTTRRIDCPSACAMNALPITRVRREGLLPWQLDVPVPRAALGDRIW